MTNSEIILYTTPKGDIKIEVFLQDETVWLTQRAMGELFGVETHTINYHLKEIFKSKELEEDSVIRKIRITAADGKKYLTNFYNLDGFLKFNDYSVLKNAGSISAEIAKELAAKEFEKFRVIQDEDYESDFDKEIKRIQGG